MSSPLSLFDRLSDPATLAMLRVWALASMPEPPYSIDDVIPLRTKHLSAALERDGEYVQIVSPDVLFVAGTSKHPHPRGVGAIDVNALAVVLETVPPMLVNVAILPRPITSPGEGWTLHTDNKLVLLKPREE